MNAINYLDDIKDLNVLVIGETIIDEYQYGYTLGKAGKFPIVAFQNQEREVYPGGVMAIRRHLKDFCNVRCYTSEKTIRKKRYVQNGQKLFETYTYDKISHYDKALTKKPNIEDYDMVIVADFGHGFITKKLREEIQEKAKWIALNTQSNAGNMGMNTINKYDKWDYVCIDENELRLATSNQYDDIENIAKKRFNPPQVASITLSKKGTMIYKDKKITHIKALIDNPIDTVGAGDAYLAITSPLAYNKAPPNIIGYIGNVAGAIACSYQGNKDSVHKIAILEYFRRNDG